MTKPVPRSVALPSQADPPYVQVRDAMDVVRALKRALRCLPAVDPEFDRRRLVALDALNGANHAIGQLENWLHANHQQAARSRGASDAGDGR